MQSGIQVAEFHNAGQRDTASHIAAAWTEWTWQNVQPAACLQQTGELCEPSFYLNKQWLAEIECMSAILYQSGLCYATFLGLSQVS